MENFVSPTLHVCVILDKVISSGSMLARGSCMKCYIAMSIYNEENQSEWMGKAKEKFCPSLSLHN